jgi:hypothetical protein
MTARIPSPAQPPSRWTDSKRLCRDGRTGSLAVSAITTKIASTPADAMPATGEDGTASAAAAAAASQAMPAIAIARCSCPR